MKWAIERLRSVRRVHHILRRRNDSFNQYLMPSRCQCNVNPFPNISSVHFILKSCNSFNIYFSRDLLFAISQKNCALKTGEHYFPANIEEVKLCTLVINYLYVLLGANYLMSLMSIRTHPWLWSFRHQWGNLTHSFSGKSIVRPKFSIKDI